MCFSDSPDKVPSSKFPLGHVGMLLVCATTLQIYNCDAVCVLKFWSRIKLQRLSCGPFCLPPSHKPFFSLSLYFLSRSATFERAVAIEGWMGRNQIRIWHENGSRTQSNHVSHNALIFLGICVERLPSSGPCCLGQFHPHQPCERDVNNISPSQRREEKVSTYPSPEVAYPWAIFEQSLFIRE